MNYLFEVVANMRLDFHFIGVEREVTVGKNIVNIISYCKILKYILNE